MGHVGDKIILRCLCWLQDNIKIGYIGEGRY